MFSSGPAFECSMWAKLKTAMYGNKLRSEYFFLHLPLWFSHLDQGIHDQHPQRGRFMEAAIHIPVGRLYAGEYIAECAKSKCGYLDLFISPNWGENLIIYLPSAVGEILYQIGGLCQEILSQRFVAKSFSHSSMRALKSNKNQANISKKVDRLHCRNLLCMDIFVCKCAVLGGYMVSFWPIHGIGPISIHNRQCKWPPFLLMKLGLHCASTIQRFLRGLGLWKEHTL